MNSFEQTLWLLSPELVLLLVGGILLGLDALRSHWDASRWTPYVALAGLVGALAATITLWGRDEPVLAGLSCDDFALVINATTLVGMGIVVLIAGEGFRTRGERQSGAFYALLLFAATGICLLGAVTDLVMLVLASELFGIASCLLLSHRSDDRRSNEAAVKVFLYSAVASALMLYGLSWFYGLAGSTDLSAIAAALGEARGTLKVVLLPALILTIVGFAGKVAAVPFHQWLPDVYEGASESAVAFFAVAPMLAGFAGLTRTLLSMLPVELQTLDVDFGTLLSALAAFTMLVGNLVALWQQSVRRFLAYLAVAQVGYLLAGIAICLGVTQADRPLAGVVAVSQQGVCAVLYTLLAHTLGALGALAAVLALSSRTRSYAIESYTGMHRRSPELAWPLLLCLLSLVGVPPTAGFFGRLYLFSAAVEAGLLWLAIVGVIGSVISLASVWKIARVLFVAPSVAEPAREEERLAVPPVLAVALGIAVVGVFALAVFADPVLGLLQAAARALFG
jgi:proton-translocating NADH-quinone oxidoreductase chain N